MIKELENFLCSLSEITLSDVESKKLSGGDTARPMDFAYCDNGDINCPGMHVIKCYTDTCPVQFNCHVFTKCGDPTNKPWDVYVCGVD